MILLSSAAFAQQPTLMSLQGKLINSSTGAKILSADLRVNINDSSGIVFNQNYSNAVSNGIFDLTLGSAYSLNLSYNEQYNLTLFVNNVSQLGEAYTFRGGQGQVGAGDIAETESYTFGNVSVIGNANITGIIESPEIDRLETNYMLNTLGMAEANSLSVRYVMDGIVDWFVDGSGIDADLSGNESFDSDGDYYFGGKVSSLNRFITNETTPYNWTAGTFSQTQSNIHNLSLGFDFGNGRDGELIVSSVNIIVNNYTYISGDEAAGQTVLTVNDASEFSAGDEILIIQMQNGSECTTSGHFEFKDIVSINSNDITIDSGIKNNYCYNAPGSTSSDIAQIVKVTHYTNVYVTSGGSITSSAWAGYSGGIIIFRANGTINITGAINAKGKGFRGGDGPTSCGSYPGCSNAYQGESYEGIGIVSTSPNIGGGGGGETNQGQSPAGGGGGGYATNGTDGSWIINYQDPGISGLSHGDYSLQNIILGSGGGGGGSSWPDGNTGGDGGIGGGIIYLIGNTINTTGSLNTNGSDGTNGAGANNNAAGGGGSGGTIILSGRIIDIGINLITSRGGRGGDGRDANEGDGGNGSNGRIRLNYVTFTGETDPPSSYNGTIDYHKSGNYTSQIFDSGTYSNWTGISWQNRTIINSSVRMNISVQTRTSNNGTAWAPWSLNHTNPSGIINTSARYLQYKAYLSTNDTSSTPYIEWVNISYVTTTTGGNLSLISQNFTSISEPSKSKLAFIMEDVDTATLNTDIKAYVSLDNGTNYEQVTLSNKGNYNSDGTKKIITGAKTLTDRNKQTMRWKIQTFNSKNIRIHGVAQNWK